MRHKLFSLSSLGFSLFPSFLKFMLLHLSHILSLSSQPLYCLSWSSSLFLLFPFILFCFFLSLLGLTEPLHCSLPHLYCLLFLPFSQFLGPALLLFCLLRLHLQFHPLLHQLFSFTHFFISSTTLSLLLSDFNTSLLRQNIEAVSH